MQIRVATLIGMTNLERHTGQIPVLRALCLLLNSFPGLLDGALHAVGLADLFSSSFPNDKTIVESLNACYDC
jgi:hypothetical protein